MADIQENQMEDDMGVRLKVGTEVRKPGDQLQSSPVSSLRQYQKTGLLGKTDGKDKPESSLRQYQRTGRLGGAGEKQGVSLGATAGVQRKFKDIRKDKKWREMSARGGELPGSQWS